MNSEKAKIRKRDVDLLRALGIIIMVLGHVGVGVGFDKFIHAFHMPMWFIISGYFYKENTDIKCYVKKKMYALFVPYIVFGIAFELLLTSTISDGKWYQALLFPNIYANGVQWFLPALMFADIIAYFVLHAFSSKIGIVLCLCIGLFGTFHLCTMPLAIDSALVGVGFFAIGIIVRKHEQYILSIRGIKLWLLMMTSFLLIFANGYVNMRTNQYSLIGLFWINATAATITLWNICKIVVDCKYNYHISSVFFNIGSESIIYPLTNHVIIRYMNLIVGSGLHGVFMIIWKMFLFIFVMVVCYYLNKIIRKSSLSWVVGAMSHLSSHE